MSENLRNGDWQQENSIQEETGRDAEQIRFEDYIHHDAIFASDGEPDLIRPKAM